MLKRHLSKFRSLRDFMVFLEEKGELKRISHPVSTVHEMTEIHKRVLEQGGSALLFEKPVTNRGGISSVPVLVNLFGTVERVAWGMGCEPCELRDMGKLLASMRQPEPPKRFGDLFEKWQMVTNALSMRHDVVGKGAVKEVVLEGDNIDLGKFPIQTCWPGEPAPLITWPLVITRPPDSDKPQDYNVGIYRMQVVEKDGALIRWLEHRGGAKHHRMWQALGKDMPVAVVIGADPATILAAVTPAPETVSELQFSGLYRREKSRLVKCHSVPLMVPAEAEIVLEGYVSDDEVMPEGPYGDHTGYYNSVEDFPVFRLSAICHRKDAVYLSTFTGRPPDEPSVLSEALNEVFIPLLQQHFPEIVDFWLPPEACSYRIAVVSIKKRYAGQARRLMMGIWSVLPQFSYTKLLIMVDEDIDPRNWAEVMWAVSTRMDPSRDLMVVDNTPIDYLDFASPVSGLGGKMGIDATNKVQGETAREWGQVLGMSDAVKGKVDDMWERLGL